MLRKALLVCGVLSSLLYVGADVLAAVRYAGYHSFTSQAISELTAVGAPTKGLVEPLFIAYDILIIAFGVGVWASAGRKRALHLVGGLLVGIGAVGLVAMPFTPMNLRGTGNLSTDAPHIAVTGVVVLLILSAIGFGAFLFGRRFRFYSFATLLTLLVFGAWTGFEATRLAAQQPTPWIGVAERIHIGAYLLWVLVLAITLLRSKIPAIQANGLEAIGRPRSASAGAIREGSTAGR
jgi:hypothetical protein